MPRTSARTSIVCRRSASRCCACYRKNPAYCTATGSCRPLRTIHSVSARLRLATYTGDKLTILEEYPLPSERGHFYFNIEEGIELGTVYLQLGRYQPNGEFVSIIERGVARIPSLYASTQTDRRWWVSDAQFREMYRRAGGLESDRQLGWAGSASSPGGALAWPGNTSSR